MKRREYVLEGFYMNVAREQAHASKDISSWLTLQ